MEMPEGWETLRKECGEKAKHPIEAYPINMGNSYMIFILDLMKEMAEEMDHCEDCTAMTSREWVFKSLKKFREWK